MPAHVVVGAGPIGSAVALMLAEQGKSVRIVTRSGAGPQHPLIERISADARDRRRLTELTTSAEVLYNCASPKYTDWERLWLPMNDAMIAAAKAADAVYAITANLYGYGPQPDGRMAENTALAAVDRKGKVRIKMWQDALNSGVRTFEARGSTYIGAGALNVFSAVILPAARKGSTAWVPAIPDLPHTFTYTGDMARTLVALACDERAYGKAWHVPSPAAVTIRQLADRYCALIGVPPLRMRTLPRFVMRTAGLIVPMARELADMDYQFYAPFVLDSTLTQTTFGLTPTNVEQGIQDLVLAAETTAARRA